MNLHAEASLNRKFVEMAQLMNVYLNHFPRHEKYALSQQIRTAAYDVYSLIVEAQKRYHKKTTLTQLDIRHEQLRMLINLAFELGYFAFKDGTPSEEKPAKLARHRHLAISRLVDELGRMIGGWLVSERQREAS
ncbi:MAG: four helix bundle protein [Dechloromonas sp.]|nr:four helix bundle protein [Dechloromonas sp.]